VSDYTRLDPAAIDTTLARRLIDTQFPQWSPLPIRTVDHDGWDNRSFRLGEQLTIRLPTGNWYALQVEKEQRWLPVLAPRLPLPIPAPVAQGAPDCGYPYPWSVYRWLDGRPASTARSIDLPRVAAALGEFLTALRAVDATDGPEPGRHNFFRGGPLSTYEAETLAALDDLDGEVDRPAAERVWTDAISSTWERDPVWVHGDVAPGNLLIRDGRLAGVLDFGSCGTGDPACDTTIAWTLLSGPSRNRFRDAMDLNDATWARGRGWALWKALITLRGHAHRESAEAGTARRHVAEVLAL
jgi:aminoglycoside phosphotransferase (APT) family kinase protein